MYCGSTSLNHGPAAIGHANPEVKCISKTAGHFCVVDISFIKINVHALKLRNTHMHCIGALQPCYVII